MAKKSAKGTSSAYRGGGVQGRGRADDEGLVQDIVRQFADPYAFYRELVQNAIDAGATQITVRLVHDEAEGLTRISVGDDGSGMSAEILEGDLTVLFKSTKEGRDDAIGKFGIGFVSVLALEPRLVAVDTSLGDGVAHRLELHPDHTYDLIRRTGGERGTTVTLHVPTTDVQELIERSLASLERWCLHAQVPITFLVHAAGRSQDPVRIERPLSIDDALIQVSANTRDRKTAVVVGLTAQGPKGAFYNRGLLLHESTEVFPAVGAVSFKVADGRLEHTLSRDDVRRDAHFASALEHVAWAVTGPLTDAVHRQLGQVPLEGWRELFDAALSSRLGLRAGELEVPLLVAIGQRFSRPLAHPPTLLGPPASPALAEALAAEGLGVLGLDADRDGARIRELARLRGHAWQAADELHALIEPLPEHALQSLVPSLNQLLAKVARKPSAIGVARFVGAAAPRLTLGLAYPEKSTVVRAADLDADPFRLLARPPLLIGVQHPVAGAAERALERGVAPATVAAMVARVILEERGRLDEQARELLLRASTSMVLEGVSR